MAGFSFEAAGGKSAANTPFLPKSKNRNPDTLCIKITVLIWWRWGELNPRPKALKQELLRAQQVFAGRRTPLFPSGQANRQACQSGSFMMHGTRKA